MNTLRFLCKKFISDERGLETVEYAIVGGIITAAVIIGIGALGQNVTMQFEALSARTSETPPAS